MSMHVEKTEEVKQPSLEEINTERLDAWKEKLANNNMEAIILFGRNEKGGMCIEMAEGEKLSYVKSVLKDAIKKIDQFNLNKNNKGIIIKR